MNGYARNRVCYQKKVVNAIFATQLNTLFYCVRMFASVVHAMQHNFLTGSTRGPCSDAGWGCMLRCGQMMLAQALTMHHLRRDWRWPASTVAAAATAQNRGEPSLPAPSQPEYWRVLQLFEDNRSAPYSIHQVTFCVLMYCFKKCNVDNS